MRSLYCSRSRPPRASATPSGSDRTKRPAELAAVSGGHTSSGERLVDRSARSRCQPFDP
jgi:hypothetical protein